MSAEPNQAQAPVRRALRLIFALQGQAFDGVRLKQLSDAVGASPSTTLRLLEVLADEGVVERIPTRDEYWRLSPRMVQIAIAHADDMRRLQQRIDDINNRYTRNPN